MPDLRPELVASRRTTGSALLGLVVFLFGIAMIALAFKLAFDLFSVPPELRLNIRQGEPIDGGQAASTILQLVVRVLMLVVMAGFGSMVANRGIKLYAAQGGKWPLGAQKPAKAASPDTGSANTETT